MPKKRDITPAPDNPDFINRLIECIGGRDASKRDFALRAGILPSTFNNYFKGVEPARDTLNKIARTAGVSVGWIVDGFGQRTFTGTPPPHQSCEVSVSQDELTLFRKNIAYFLEEHDGHLEGHGISRERLMQLSSHGVPTYEEISILGWNFFTRDWEAFHKPILGDSKVTGRPGEPLTVEFSKWSRLLADQIMHELVMMTGTSELMVVKIVDDRMEPSLPENSVVFVALRRHLSGPGIYLFRKEQRDFVARALVRIKSGRVFLTFDNPDYKDGELVEYNSSEFECVGQVVLVVTKPKRRAEFMV